MDPRPARESENVDDSGVYSFHTKNSSQNTSSMSSFSISSISMEDSKASSSGCSSLMVSERHAHWKELMKHRVKKCLEELKTLVHAPSTPKKKGDTLKTLQHVIQQMKKYKEEEGGGGVRSHSVVDTELVGVSSEGECVGIPLQRTPSIDSNNWYKIVTSDSECTVLDASPGLLKMLRYPGTYWKGQPLLEYIHRRDVVTFSNHLLSAQAAGPKNSKDEKDDREETDNNVFFFRIRHYKSIRQGYSLSRSEKYTVFCGRVERPKVQFDWPQRPQMPQTSKHLNGERVMLECSPVLSAYLSPCHAPENRTFSTRHTIHCKYNFVHPSCIALTGFLPQDLIGTSIFDNYHPHDLSILLGSYQQVVATFGETFKSVPYRMRIKNGQYITVETEWSSFINPWSNKLDFIIGYHTVLEGPRNTDVFNQFRKLIVELTPQARSLQKRIRALLLQAEASGGESSSAPRGPTSSLDVKTVAGPTASTAGPSTFSPPLPADLTFKPKVVEEEENKELPTADAKNSSSGSCETKQHLMNEKINIYEQLNYAHNIRRFLLSCALSQETSGDSSSTKSTIKDENLELLADKASSAVNLTLPKPPSFASSTKALISEREQWEEVMPPSPTHEETVEDHPAVTEDTYQHIRLTEEVIELHNKYQLQSYLSKLSAEKDIQMLNRLHEQSLPQGNLKRSHGDDEDEVEKKHKVSREENYLEPSPNRNPPNPSRLIFPCMIDEPQPVFNNPNIGAGHHHSSNLGHHGAGLLTAGPQAAPAGPVRPPSAAAGAPQGIETMRWPSIDRGFSYMAVPGSYLPPVSAQPVMNMCQKDAEKPSASASPGTSGTSNAVGSLNRTTNSKSCGKTSDSSGSLDDYSSSVFFLLDSGSQNNSHSHSTPSDLEDLNRMARKNSPWCKDLKWTKDIEMRYSMALGKSDRVLEDDLMYLNKFVQPRMVEEQIEDLLSENNPPENFLMDDDCLIKPYYTMNDDDKKETEEEDVDMPVDIKIFEDKEGDREKDDKVDSPPAQVLPDERQKNLSDSDSSDGNTSKSSSDITPSDQRSHDELPSSGKESDNLSTENQKRGSKRDSAGAEAPFGGYLMDRLCMPLNVNYQPYLGTPPWLAKTHFNEAIQMRYQKPTDHPVQDVLQMDQNQLSHMEQPQEVRKQLDELLADLKQTISYALTPVTPKVHSPDWGSVQDKSSSSNTLSPDSGSNSPNSKTSSVTSSNNDVSNYNMSSSSGSEEGKDIGEIMGSLGGNNSGDVAAAVGLADRALSEETTHDPSHTESDGAGQQTSGTERDSGIKSDTRDFSTSSSTLDDVVTQAASSSTDMDGGCCSMSALFTEMEQSNTHIEMESREEEHEPLASSAVQNTSHQSPTLGIIMDLFVGSEQADIDVDIE